MIKFILALFSLLALLSTPSVAQTCPLGHRWCAGENRCIYFTETCRVSTGNGCYWPMAYCQSRNMCIDLTSICPPDTVIHKDCPIGKKYCWLIRACVDDTSTGC